MLEEQEPQPHLCCTECGTPAHGKAIGWNAYLSGGFDDEPLEVVVFCPACATRELIAAA